MTMMMLLLSAVGTRVFLTGTLSAQRASNGTPQSPNAVAVNAGFQVNSDGQLYRTQAQTLTPSWVAQPADGWLSGGTAANYDVRFTKGATDPAATLSGSATSGTWYNLASSRHVGYAVTADGGFQQGTWTIDIARSTDHSTILATATATISAASNSYNP